MEKIWGITYHTQASIRWIMNLLWSLAKGSNFIPSQKKQPILDHNMVKTDLCKQVSKSVSLLVQRDKIYNSVFELPWLCYEKHKVNLHCYQNLKVVSRQEKKVVLKAWSISDVNLPEVTYHAQILDILVWSFPFFLTPETLTLSLYFFLIHWKEDAVEENLWSADNEMPFSLPTLLIFLDPGEASIFSCPFAKI